MSFQAWRCRCDMLWHAVPNKWYGSWKSMITNSWQECTSTTDDRCWWWGRMQVSLSVEIRRLGMTVWLRVDICIQYKPELDLFQCLEPVQLMEEWSDVFEHLWPPLCCKFTAVCLLMFTSWLSLVLCVHPAHLQPLDDKYFTEDSGNYRWTF